MSDNVALCVDLDGTLIHSDLLLESFLLLIKDNPFYLLLVPFWLLGGKARLKREIASRVTLDGSALPYTKPLVAWLQEQKAAGRQLWLCTASDESSMTVLLVSNNVPLLVWPSSMSMPRSRLS